MRFDKVNIVFFFCHLGHVLWINCLTLHSTTPTRSSQMAKLSAVWAMHMSLCQIITACTVVQAVVKATSQSNGKSQILTPWGSKTPERISMKLGIYNRVAGMPTHANPCGAATTWVVWANTWKNTLWFLRYTFFKFFALFFGSRRARTRGPILTIYTSYDVFPPKDVPFGGLVHTAPILGVKCPKNPYFGGVNRHFQA